MKEYIIKVDEQKTDIDGGMPLQNKPQELVRCKDCIFYNSLMGHCKDGRSYPSPDWFCADGVRRE